MFCWQLVGWFKIKSSWVMNLILSMRSCSNPKKLLSIIKSWLNTSGNNMAWSFSWTWSKNAKRNLNRKLRRITSLFSIFCLTLSRIEVLFLPINILSYLQITKLQWKRREKVLTKVLIKATIKVLIKASIEVLIKVKRNPTNHFYQWNQLWKNKKLTRIFFKIIECQNKLNHNKATTHICQDWKNHQVPIELPVLLPKVLEALSSKEMIVLFLLHPESWLHQRKRRKEIQEILKL